HQAFQETAHQNLVAIDSWLTRIVEVVVLDTAASREYISSPRVDSGSGYTRKPDLIQPAENSEAKKRRFLLPLRSLPFGKHCLKASSRISGLVA
ncbi:MAG: hypothetical protein AAF991_12800, partial [Pseudomonadota bacterium]